MKQASIILKDGYRLKFVGDHVLLGGPDMKLYMVAISSIKSGEEIPRESDEVMKWDI